MSRARVTASHRTSPDWKPCSAFGDSTDHTRDMSDDEVAAVLAEALAARRPSCPRSRQLAALLREITAATWQGQPGRPARRLNAAADILDGQAGVPPRPRVETHRQSAVDLKLYGKSTAHRAAYDCCCTWALGESYQSHSEVLLGSVCRRDLQTS